MSEELPNELTVLIRRDGTLSLDVPLEETILGGTKYIRVDLIKPHGVCADCKHIGYCSIEFMGEDNIDKSYCSEFEGYSDEIK